MLKQINLNKASLLSLNDDQLQTTTRLTILQNTQLTVELEYQSKQTEQLLLKNTKMQQQIDTLQRDINIHKEVESELAKRSHFCQKVIKRLRSDVKELSDKLEGKIDQTDMKTPKAFGSNQKMGSLFSGSKTMRHANDKKINLGDDMKSSEGVINFLETKLDQHEKNLSKRQAEYEALQSEYYELQEKFNQSRNKYKRAALILTDYLEDILNKQPNIF